MLELKTSPALLCSYKMKLLGIDVGTGGTRALVLDERDGVVASATAEHAPFASPQTGWAEQDPRDWWRATARAVRELSERHSVAGEKLLRRLALRRVADAARPVCADALRVQLFKHAVEGFPFAV